MPSKKPAVASTLPPATTADELNIDSPYSPFPIICVGASAGGLESCEALFSALPENCGMSFVVVVHLAPAHVSLMSELLQKNSKLPVCQITDGLQIKMNNIYVIPPNKELNILQGKL